MHHYRVQFVTRAKVCTVLVNADSEDEALESAERFADGGDFVPTEITPITQTMTA